MKKSLLLVSFILFGHSLFGQIEATTKEGRKVILNNDGTWKYVDVEATISTESLECSALVESKVDKVTGDATRQGVEAILATKDRKNGLGFYLFRAKSGSLVLSITAVGAGSCIEDDGKMNVLFRDGSRLELINDSKFNCDAKFTLYFGGVFGKKKELEAFMTKEIETARVWTSKGFVQEDFTPETSKKIMKTIACLMEP